MPEATVDPRVQRTTASALEAARHLLVTRGIGAVTHLHVAKESGLGRKTVYRHWPSVDHLLYDTFASADFPHAVRTGDPRADLVAHLEALRRALVLGPLKYLIHALNERAATDPAIASLRDRLTDEGCAPIRQMLRDAVRSGSLARDTDIDFTAGQLEGPIFYRALVRNQRIPLHLPMRLVDTLAWLE